MIAGDRALFAVVMSPDLSRLKGKQAPSTYGDVTTALERARRHFLSLSVA